MYKEPNIKSGAGVLSELAGLTGRTLVVTMDLPWDLACKAIHWEPDHVHMVTDMDVRTLETLQETLPPCDTVVGLGGGSCCDTAKYLAYHRGCRMILVPSIVSVDAPLTNTVAVRVNNTVRYVCDIYPRELIVDHDLIRQAPPELNRAGACDIASIHTALFDWKLAHEHTGEAYSPEVAKEAAQCLAELGERAEAVYNVTPKGIDTIIDLFRREVRFCADIGTSRPEEGAEHIVCYNLEHLTGRHFLHGDLVGLGIFAIARLQDNAPEEATELIRRCGLRYTVPGAAEDEIRRCLQTLKPFKDEAGLFFSIVDTNPPGEAFVEETLAALYGR